MADVANKDTQTATPPATSGGITKEDLAAAIAAATKPLAETIAAMQANQKVLGDTLAALPPAKKEDTAKPGLTAEDVAKLIASDRQAQQQTAEQTAARQKFVGEKLAKLPAVYQDKLGADPKLWDEQAKAIQSQFEADFKAGGGKGETVGDPAKEGGATPADKAAASTVSNLPDGVAKFAAAMKLPA